MRIRPAGMTVGKDWRRAGKTLTGVGVAVVVFLALMKFNSHYVSMNLSYPGHGEVTNLTTSFSNLSVSGAQKRCHRQLTKNTYNCRKIRRFGHKGDGGYDLCLHPPFVPQRNNCLVYSFGVRDDWSFDEAVNDEFQCEVHSFDPSIGGKDHLHRPPNMYFHNLGIWGSNVRNDQGWELRDLTTIMGDLGHTHRDIDYLKVDVEGAEWPMINHITSSGLHSKIKQMGLEYHTPRFKGDVMTTVDYEKVYDTLLQLKLLGFEQFRNHQNNGCCGRFAMFTPKNIARKRLCCYESVYVNTNFT